MAENYVQIKVKASDTAKPDLASLRAQLAEIGSAVENAKVGLDDDEGKAQLLDWNAKLAALNEKVANPKIKLAGAARAEAQIAALDAQIRKSGQDSTDAKTRFGALGKAVSGLTLGVSGGFAEMTLFQKAMAGLSVSTGIGEPLIAGLTVAVGGLSAGLVAGGVGLGVFGLVAKTAFTQASTAATSAQTAQTTYGNAVQAANLKYQQSMASATTASQRQAAAAAQTNAVQSAALTRTQALNTAYAGMSQSQIKLSQSITTAKNAWSGFVSANTSGVSAILSQGLGLLPNIFSMLQPFLQPTEQALSGLIKDIGQAIAPAQKLSGAVHGMLRAPADAAGTGSLRSFFTLLSTNAGPSITKIGIALGHLVTGITGVLSAFMPMAQQMLGGLDKLTGKFAVWGQTLSGHTGFQSLLAMFKTETPVVMNDLKNLAGIVKTVISSMAGMNTISNSTSLFKLAGPILAFVNALLKAHPGLVNLILYTKLAADAGGKLKTAFSGIQSGLQVLSKGKQVFNDFSAGFGDANAAASAFTGVWGTIGGKMATAVSAVKEWSIWSKIAGAATKVWTGIQAAFDLVMDANPIALIVIAIVALIAIIVILTIKFKWMRDFWKAAWADIKAAAVAAFHFLESAVKGWVAEWVAAWHLAQDVVRAVMAFVRGWISTEVDAVKTVLSWFGQLGGLFRGWWDAAVSAVENAVGRLMSDVRAIPGKIASALAGLGGMMLQAGEHAMDSLISGIENKVGHLGSVMGGVASKIAGFIGLSPAKEGPLSGGGAPQVRGQHIAADIAAGMLQGVPRIGAAATRLAGASGISSGGGALGGASAGGGGQITLRIEGGSGELDQFMIQWLRRNTRVLGGGGPNSAQRAWGQVA